MEIIGLNMDDTPLYADDKSLRYAKNLNVGVDGKTYCNDFGYDRNVIEAGNGLCGIIKLPDGWVAFYQYRLDEVNPAPSNDYIARIKIIDGVETVTRRIFGTWNFSYERPITGDYTYNGNNELIIAFSEGVGDDANESRIVNVDNPLYDGNAATNINLTNNQILEFNTIPDVMYPNLKLTRRGGGLNSGTYQVAIKYKLKDGSYTNYSILSTPISIIGPILGNTPPNTITSEGITVTWATKDSKYSIARLAIVFKTEEANLAYETSDFSVNSTYNATNTYTITNLSGYNSISLEDIFVHTIGYIKEAAIANFQDRLYRANVKTFDYAAFESQLQTIANNIQLSTYNIVSLGGAEQQKIRYFQFAEIYSFYALFFDTKGNFINAYRIPYKAADTGFIAVQQPDNFRIHRIYNNNYNGATGVYAYLPSSTTAPRPSILGNVAIAYVKHTENNSFVLSNPITCPDQTTNNFGQGQQYAGQWRSNTNTRVFSFEYMFNRASSISGVITFGNLTTLSTTVSVDDDLVPQAVQMSPNATYDGYGLAYIEMTKNSNYVPTGSTGTERTFTFIDADNTNQANTAGPSYFRVPVGSNVENGIAAVAYITNTTSALYADSTNENLAIASGMITASETGGIELQGDTFAGWLTIRDTQPANNFQYGSGEESATNDYVCRHIIVALVESKLNISGRYSVNSIDAVYKLQQSGVTNRTPLYRLDYTVDNLINNNNGRGYSTSYNDVGIEDFVYYDNLPAVSNYINRIVRSPVLGSEAASVAWHSYYANDYRDMPGNRGEIIELKTDQRYMYVQQKFGLRLIFLRDQVSNDSENSTYLGSSDLFDREPIEVLYDSNGYIGCLNKFDTFICLAGYYVIDADKGAIYNVFGQDATRLSDLKMIKYFKQRILNSPSNNPFSRTISFGRWFEYNDYNKTISVYQDCTAYNQPTENYNQFGIRFSIVHNKWISECIDKYGYSFDTRSHNYSVYKLSSPPLVQYTYYQRFNPSIHGIYPNVTNAQYDPTVIAQIVFNRDASVNKMLEHISWIDRMSYINDHNEVVPFNETINQIMVHNSDQCTGYKTVAFNSKWYDGRTGVNQANTWHFNNAKDLVKAYPFLNDNITVIDTALKVNPKWYNLKEIISQYIIATLKLNQNNSATVGTFNPLWQLEEIEANWIVDNRVSP